MNKLFLIMMLFSICLFAEEKEQILTQVQKDEIAKIIKAHWQHRTEFIKLLHILRKRGPRYIAMRIKDYDKTWNLEKIINNVQEKFALENKKLIN